MRVADWRLEVAGVRRLTITRVRVSPIDSGPRNEDRQ